MLLEMFEYSDVRGLVLMKKITTKNGFTLVELLVAMAIVGIVAVAMYSLFISNSRTYENQEQALSLHQNLRVAMEVIQRDLRTAGFDPQIEQIFGITDVQSRDLAYVLSLGDENSIQFTADLDSNGVIGAGELMSYSIYDSPVAAPDGITDLARNPTGVAPLTDAMMLGEGVESIGFAYAYADDDGTLVTNPVSDEPLWAYDSNNDNILDSRVDQDLNGIIDINDADVVVALPLLISGGNTATLDRIRAVKIWILGRSLRPDLQYQPGNLIFKVGNRRIQRNDNIRRQLLTSVVKFRNLGL